MKVISHETIQALSISPIQFYQWVENMLRRKADSILPPKISMSLENHIFYNVMPCILPTENYMGVKIITRHPENQEQPSLSSQIFLYDLSNGELVAILDGSYITAMRTGAVAAHSVRLFAKKNFSHIGIIGLGITATTAMDCLSALYPREELTVHLLQYKEQAETFAQRYRENNNLNFRFYTTPKEVIRSSEVVLSAVTYTEKDFADITDFQPGCLVIPIHTRGFQNCDLAFDKIYTDDIGHIEHFKNFQSMKCLAEVSSVLKGEISGRENNAERILVYNIGLALHDIYAASQILQLLPYGNEVMLSGPKEKMWLRNKKL